MMIKALINKLRIYRDLRRFLQKRREKRLCMQAFRHDAEVFYENSILKQETSARRVARILKRCHVLEKGLTMPDRRAGFGKDNLLALLADLRAGMACGEALCGQLAYAASVVAEYRDYHLGVGHALDPDLSQAMDRLLKDIPACSAQQPETSRDAFFSKIHAPFDVFSASRRSIRAFDGSVSIEQIRSAVEIANQAPSACNRQPCRVHLVASHPLIRQCLALQNGNRGFGHLVDKLLVVTADQQAVWINERNDLYTNGGIYLMNLCYALHFNRVAHCILNWSPECEDFKHPYPGTKKLSSLLDLTPSERVVALVACGGLPDTFKMTLSARKHVAEVLIVHE